MSNVITIQGLAMVKNEALCVQCNYSLTPRYSSVCDIPLKVFECMFCLEFVLLSFVIDLNKIQIFPCIPIHKDDVFLTSCLLDQSSVCKRWLVLSTKHFTFTHHNKSIYHLKQTSPLNSKLIK